MKLLLLVAMCAANPWQKPKRKPLVTPRTSGLPENFCPQQGDVCMYKGHSFAFGQPNIPSCWFFENDTMYCLFKQGSTYCGMNAEYTRDISKC
ncbi:hypothetical protein DSO57_1000480 [Entomophthora muscae]|uniref:Uncharacterized protein n=1 Tax=Entomophthora muscae TaxID=34485 RepID=A0ACC2UVB4_9FUNG|nr:hypothetical protein DSO57_1000480 [Entomophthora muscae]